MRKLLKALLVLGIMGAGAAIFMYMVSTKTKPGKSKVGERPVLVEAIEAKASQDQVSVAAMGTVIPARSVTVFPEVAGRILYQSKKLVPGGRFRSGETLIRIDARDYELAVKQQQARVVQAGAALAQERGMKAVAEREWKMIEDEVQPTVEGRKLALREVQLETAQANLDSAKSMLEQAELMRGRTAITAPFDCVVTEEFVDRGQVVSNATRIATLVDSQKFWVRVSMPVDRLSWIHIPGVNAKEGSPVSVVQQAGQDLTVERSGSVVRLLGDLDPKGRMARLLVEVNNPLGTPGENGTVMPLLLGAYVKVAIEGLEVEDLIVLPRLALRDQNRVWVKTQEKKLSIRKVTVVWSRADAVFVRGDLHPGETVVTSRISTPVEGMLLRTPDDPPPPEAEESPDPGEKKDGP